ncbi:thiopeptide-type bacteriocin biosynthesis protein [Saccharothrix tamanrassetensis]|uniref:Thiopeptide-type bacteriocin biosynthesis protein n=1 Tax=Saccharothrix tamanrassetensis TaxID=1051531 RepID=A0A841CJ31_9PSEU|nr:lantibiotic dehydratase [Saccharothrix tamanrassetensis]MBB5958482.1 thiopeptide-type bacteriocin biosynthesis protein [Saccharothrix tamanrassetensis]
MSEPSRDESLADERAGYRAAGFYLLRVPTLPSGEYLDMMSTAGADQPAREHDDADLDRLRDEGRKRLREIAARPRVAQALRVASPSLVTGLAKLESGNARKPGRVYASLLRYLTRMATRPTPYGLFAAVGMGEFAATTAATLATDPVAETRTRADLAWLLALIKAIEEDGARRDELRVAVNPLLYQVGNRAVLPFADVHGQSDNRSIAFRVTEPVRVALRAAQLPGTGYADVVAAVRDEMPGATEEQVRTMLGQLWDVHVVTSDLRPSLTVSLPELDLVEKLDGLPGCAAVQDELRRLRTLTTTVDEGRGCDGGVGLDELSRQQRALTPGYDGDTYQLDTGLAMVDRRLSEDVARTAEDAVRTLTRLGASPGRPQHIVEYHNAFLERYGIGAEVPVLELLSPEAGLDAPATYLSPARSYPLPVIPEEDHSHRDMVLSAFASRALYRGDDAVELTDERLATLTAHDSPGGHVAARPSLDLYMQLAAESRAALDRGDWRMVLCSGSTTDGGRTFGRFFDLFGPESLAKLVEFTRAEERLLPDVVFAELSYLTPFGRSGNVTVHPPLRRHEVCVNTAPSVPEEQRIPLGDIHVGATVDRFYLRSRRLGKELYITQSHMLGHIGAPNVCRLLLELSQDLFALLPSFDWGVVGAAPYLPRVTRGRVVLHPAQWRLGASSLPGLAKDADLPDDNEFFGMVRQWRREWNVPRYVYLVWMDNRLLLDLEHPLAVDELRYEVRRAMRSDRRSGVLLHEMLPGFSDAWLTDTEGKHYQCEVVVPLLAKRAADVRRPAIGAAPVVRGGDAPGLLPGGTATVTPDRRKHIGSEWVYLKLYAATVQQDDIVTGAAASLIAALRAEGSLDRWFYLRYGDPEPHLRIRLRVRQDHDSLAVLARTAEWARGLVEAGQAADFAFTSYQREIERYGGREMIDTAESVFERSSEVSIGLLDVLRRHKASLEPEVVCVLAMHELCRAWGRDPVHEIRPGAELDVSGKTRAHFRTVQSTLCDLLEPWDEHPDPVARSCQDELRRVFAGQRETVAAAGERARSLAAQGLLAGSEDTILGSLVHMQVNRLLGIAREREVLCHELWSLARRSIRRRPGWGEHDDGEQR